MGECGVCGRDRGRGAHAGDPLFVTSESAECYRLGYDRSQAALAAADARADAAEHDLRNAEAVIKHGADCLAAARRECEVMASLLVESRALARCCRYSDLATRISAALAAELRAYIAARAAKAKGEGKT